MEEMKLSWSIPGEFVTKTAREWLFYEHKPYAVVEEFLLACMEGTDLSKEELKLMAQDVLLGRAKFIGNTSDGSYAYAKDDSGSSIFEFVDKITAELKAVKEELDIVVGKYLDIQEALVSHDLRDIRDKEDKRLMAFSLPNLFDSYERTATLEVKKIEPALKTGIPILDEMFNALKYEDNYGFIKPDGEFIPVDIGHLDYAEILISELGWEEDFDQWVKNKHSESINGLHVDFLIYTKGFILLHSPSRGTAIPVYDEIKGITKQQKDFLYGYYVDRQELTLANQIFNP